MSAGNHGFSRAGGRKGENRPFDTLKDDSEVELQPGKARFTVEAGEYPGQGTGKPMEDTIRVERKWEVTSDIS